MPFDLFLSHSATDDVLAERLASAFMGGQVSCWLDHRAIQPGENWDQEIHRALLSCRAGCFLLTPNSESSDECHAEWRSVLQQKKRLYVVIFGEPHNFPYRLRLIQYVDLST